MKKELIWTLPVLVVLLSLAAGCQSMTYSISPTEGTSVGKPATAAARGFERKVKAHYMFWGLLPVSTPDINELARKETGTGKVLSNIVIKEQNTFVDGLLALITYGIYRPRTVSVSGTVL